MRFRTAPPNLEPRDDIWPTDPAPVIRRHEDGVELVQLRWGFPPGRPKAAPVINFSPNDAGSRLPVLGAGVALLRVHRHEVAKTKWKFTKADEDWFCFAGLWRPTPDGGEALTILTTEPGPAVAPIHNRHDLTRPEAELLRPLPSGSLAVKQVR